MLFVFAAFQTFAKAQAPIKFRKVIGNSGYETGYSVKQTNDKGFIIGGSTSSFGEGNTDMYVVKTDSMGIPRNHKTFGGINVDIGKCIRRTIDNGYILLGYTNSFGAGGYDFYLIKMDSALNEQWSKTYGGTDWDFGNCIEQTNDGGYVLCGSTYSLGNGESDYYLIKTDSVGNTLWEKTFGGLKEDIANSVIQSSDGGYVLTGTTKSLGDTLGDFYTIKTNALGDTVWTNKFGGAYLDYGNDVIESQFGGYIVGGETQSYSYVIGSSDGIIQKISPTGITYYTYSVGYSSPLFDNIESVAEAVNGDIAMVGRDVSQGDTGGNGDVHLFIITSTGAVVGVTSFGFNYYDIGYSIELTSDHGYIICGYTTSFNNHLNDIYLIKTDSIGSAGIFDSNVLINVPSYSLSQNVNFKVYPNPAQSTITILSEKTTEEGFVKISDLIGREYMLEKTSRNQNFPYSLNVSNLKNGIYIVNISTSKGSFSQKLIIQH